MPLLPSRRRDSSMPVMREWCHEAPSRSTTDSLDKIGSSVECLRHIVGIMLLGSSMASGPFFPAPLSFRCFSCVKTCC